MRKKYPCELHPDYARWLSITQRCTNPNSNNYKNYGAKGVQIAECFADFKTFASYIEKLPNYGIDGVSLDRIKGKLGYTPGNLRWSTRSVQNSNQLESGKGSNKYTGVNWSVTHKRWIARVTLESKTLLSKVCLTEPQALEVRNQFIKDNNLPHVIQKWIDE